MPTHKLTRDGRCPYCQSDNWGAEVTPTNPREDRIIYICNTCSNYSTLGNSGVRYPHEDPLDLNSPPQV